MLDRYKPKLIWRLNSSEMLGCFFGYVITDVSKDFSAFIFRVKESKKIFRNFGDYLLYGKVINHMTKISTAS
jgi:hypothetical protein